MHLGAGDSLDVANDGIYEPTMAPTGNYSGQVWTITPITTGQWALRSGFHPELSFGDAEWTIKKLN